MGREYLRKLESQGRADELRFSSFSLKRKLFFIIIKLPLGSRGFYLLENFVVIEPNVFFSEKNYGY